MNELFVPNDLGQTPKVVQLLQDTQFEGDPQVYPAGAIMRIPSYHAARLRKNRIAIHLTIQDLVNIQKRGQHFVDSVPTWIKNDG
jgi:hypothetical protein